MTDHYSEEFLRGIALGTRTIAMVGASVNPARPSFRVMQFLQRSGYRVIPVNPAQAGQRMNGEIVYPDFASIPAEAGDIQMVDIFRRPDDVLPVVEAAIENLGSRGLRTVWMQLGIVNQQAAELAESAGLQVVMNRCPTREWPRFLP